MKSTNYKPRGFSVMSKEEVRRIATLGGLAVSSGKQGRKHMAEIGAIGGAVTTNRRKSK